MTAQEPLPWILEAARLADLFAQLMSKALSERLLQELPEAKRLELTRPQMLALRYLWLHTDVFVGELAEGLDIQYPSATNMVKRLEEKGLVCRQSNPKDRRAVRVALTGHGRALVERLENERLRRLTDLLERMSESDRDALLRGLRGFIGQAVEGSVQTASDICLRCGMRASSTCPLAEIIPLFACK